MSVATKLKKGDICAIEITRASTTRDFKAERYSTYAIAKVLVASKEGEAKKVSVAAGLIQFDLVREASKVKVFALPDEYLESASHLYETREYPEYDFVDKQALKLALKRNE